ncbi:hypothetical protein JK628_11055 [Shewanella sp. KX20019]|uniref:hypothetical protein n=1 Tax=Shewanella sp. KX20019 TaxID=2803864 RepID=UPI001927D241|nr:hypothetical protein [Shewanella sp. KX20019]QQX82294.1 hypothetical protein JK628_11055 [Shewanella sp. KX20019]
MKSMRTVLVSFCSIYIVPIWLMFLVVIINLSTPIHTDIGWLYFATKQWLAGKELYTAIFEINPPMIFILMTPITYIESITGFTALSSTRIYFLFFVSVVTIINLYIMRTVISKSTFVKIYIPLLIITTFIMPYKGFSQRDHLAILLMLPYFISRFNDFQGSYHLNRYMVFLIGILAGVGICIKPYFILFPIFCESWYLIKVKKLSELPSLTTIVMLFVTLLFYAILFLYWDGYLGNIIPWGLATYWTYGKEIDYPSLILNILVLVLIFFAAIKLRRKEERELTLFLCFMSLPALLSYLIQAHYSYQLLPFKTLLMINGVLTTYFYTKQFAELKSILVLLKVLLIFWGAVFSYRLILEQGQLMLTLVKFHRAPTFSEMGYEFLEESAYTINTKFSGKPVYVLSSNVWPSAFISSYTDGVWVSGFPAMWPLPAINIMDRFPERITKSKKHDIARVKEDVLTSIRCEIVMYEPVAIFVDAREKPDYFGGRFKYVDFFKQESMLETIFDNYELSEMKINFFKGHHYDVYLRSDKNAGFINRGDIEYCSNYSL